MIEPVQIGVLDEKREKCVGVAHETSVVLQRELLSFKNIQENRKYANNTNDDTKLTDFSPTQIMFFFFLQTYI